MIENIAVRASPYRGRMPRTFWRSSVSGRRPGELQDAYEKKFEIGPNDRIATAGSCFAQHISRHLRSNGYRVLDTEPAPPWMNPTTAEKFGFGVYSARFGNIYYVRQLLQLAQEALGHRVPTDVVWEKDGRFFDALRPTVEPNGHASFELVAIHRSQHVRRFRDLLESCDVFIFTMGLTEGWVHSASGTVFPTAPGTVAGSFDPDTFHFQNFDYEEVLEDFLEFRALCHAINPLMKFILTVSPVPLAATADDDHVLVSTMYSKAVLRAVAGKISKLYSDVDYFPSYELITGIPSGNSFFDDDLRNVTSEGVEYVMSQFFSQHPSHLSEGIVVQEVAGASTDTVFCEEALLEAFGA